MTTIVRMLAVTALVSMASAAQAQNRLPSERGLEALVKATLLTFNDANVTGNYEVFHAKPSKAFREQYPVERLAPAVPGVQQEAHRLRRHRRPETELRPRAQGRRRGQAPGERPLPNRAAAGQFRPRLHPVRRRMEADQHQRQDRRPEVTTIL
jgi:hypothetical protein